MEFLNAFEQLVSIVSLLIHGQKSNDEPDGGGFWWIMDLAAIFKTLFNFQLRCNINKSNFTDRHASFKTFSGWAGFT